MTTKAERIAAAVFGALTSPPMTSVPASRVFRDLEGALQSDLLPAVAVESGDEDPPARLMIGKKSRRIEVRVIVIVAGGFAVADPVLVESFGRLTADPSLGGLVFELNESTTHRARDDAESQRCAVTKTYTMQFFTAENSLET